MAATQSAQKIHRASPGARIRRALDTAHFGATERHIRFGKLQVYRVVGVDLTLRHGHLGHQVGCLCTDLVLLDCVSRPGEGVSGRTGCRVRRQGRTA